MTGLRLRSPSLRRAWNDPRPRRRWRYGRPVGATHAQERARRRRQIAAGTLRAVRTFYVVPVQEGRAVSPGPTRAAPVLATEREIFSSPAKAWLWRIVLVLGFPARVVRMAWALLVRMVRG